MVERKTRLATAPLGATGLEITRVGFGRSEEVVGRALDGMPREERPFVFTKASLLEGPGRRVEHDLSRDSILREADASLRRLGIDAIDLYQIHWPIPEPDIEEGWAAYAELKEQGLVRHIGVSNFGVGQLRRIQGIARLPDDDWRRHDPRFREPQLSRHLALVRRLTRVAGRHGVSPGAVAVAWTLRNGAVDAAIVGARRPDQIDPIVVAAGLELDHADLALIEGLVWP